MLKVVLALALVFQSLIPAFIEAAASPTTTVNALPTSGGSIIPLTVNNFAQEIEKSQGMSIVVFSASWCGACKQLKPVMQEMSQKYAGKIKFGLVDIDQSRPLSDKFSVKNLPTTLFLKDGKVLQSKIGYLDKGTFEKTLRDIYKF